MEGGLPKEDDFSTKVMNSSLLPTCLCKCIQAYLYVSCMRLSLLHLHVLR